MHRLFILSVNQIQLKCVALKHTFSKLVRVTGIVIQKNEALPTRTGVAARGCMRSAALVIEIRPLR